MPSTEAGATPTPPFERPPRARSLTASRPWVFLALAAVSTSLLVYLPYLGHMDTIYRYWDGPSYLTIARNGYRPGSPLAPGAGTPKLVAHLPLYPLLVRGLDFLGPERALLAGSILPTIAATLIFFRLARDVWGVPSPAYLSLLFLLLPPRWLIYHSVGASEPLFLALLLGSIACFEARRTGYACLLAGLASLTRLSGIMILPAYALLLAKDRRRGAPWLLLIPAGLGGYFLYCGVRFGNFFAPLEPNLDKISSPVPFAFLRWLIRVGHLHQAEFYVLLAFVYAVGISRLRAFPTPMTYAAFQLLFYLFLSTEDWSRYFLTMAPFALILGYRDVLDTRAVRWILPGYLAASLVYVWNAIPANLCPPDLYLQLRTYLHL